MDLNLPYTALRAFEAAVRLRSFSAAAAELGVSQSAISQHVRALEEWTGETLIVRGPRRSQPTPHGQMLASAIAEGLGRISEVCLHLRDRRRDDPTITISCLPGFAFVWLFPRLIRFDIAHPEYPVSVMTDTRLANFAADGVDLAIRYGLGGYPGLHVERLMQERVFPVCAPSLLEAGPPLRGIADLARHTLLEDQIAEIGGSPPTWAFWAQETGQHLPKPQRSRRFGQSNLVTQAAIQGLGVALGREPLVIDALHAGALVRPLPQVAVSQFGYWLVCPPRHAASEKVARFRDWILAEVAAQPDIPPPLGAPG
jgi:LysR family glycine cleavage system transcriptional activator